MNIGTILSDALVLTLALLAGLLIGKMLAMGSSTSHRVVEGIVQWLADKLSE